VEEKKKEGDALFFSPLPGKREISLHPKKESRQMKGPSKENGEGLPLDAASEECRRTLGRELSLKKRRERRQPSRQRQAPGFDALKLYEGEGFRLFCGGEFCFWWRRSVVRCPRKSQEKGGLAVAGVPFLFVKGQPGKKREASYKFNGGRLLSSKSRRCREKAYQERKKGPIRFNARETIGCSHREQSHSSKERGRT